MLPALVAGVAVGLAMGGRLPNLSLTGLRLLPLLVVGVLLQAASGLVGPMAAPVLITSDAALLLFALANFRRTGMLLVAAGIALNLLPIATDGGMPVSRHAAAQLVSSQRLEHTRLSGKHHFARPHDSFLALSDIVPVPALRTIVSPGDIVLSVGMAAVIASLLRRRVVVVRTVELRR